MIPPEKLRAEFMLEIPPPGSYGATCAPLPRVVARLETKGYDAARWRLATKMLCARASLWDHKDQVKVRFLKGTTEALNVVASMPGDERIMLDFFFDELYITRPGLYHLRFELFEDMRLHNGDRTLSKVIAKNGKPFVQISDPIRVR